MNKNKSKSMVVRHQRCLHCAVHSLYAMYIVIHTQLVRNGGV